MKFALLYTLAFLFAVMIAMNFAFGIGAAIGAVMRGHAFGIFLGGSFAFLGVPPCFGFWVMPCGAEQFQGRARLAMPLVGFLYEWIFAPTTFYAFDKALMFRDAVHNGVLEVIDTVTANKGVRALSEEERKPALKKFAASV